MSACGPCGEVEDPSDLAMETSAQGAPVCARSRGAAVCRDPCVILNADCDSRGDGCGSPTHAVCAMASSIERFPRHAQTAGPPCPLESCGAFGL
eukprot:7384795-Prymnesium_polylepis.1